MDNKILRSMVSITAQRDVESLDRNLVTVLAENLSLKNVFLYKLENEKNSLERVISLTVLDNDEGNKPKYCWDDGLNITGDKQYLIACLSNRESVTYRNENNQEYLVSPLKCDEKIIGVIEMGPVKNLDYTKELFNQLFGVYGNCLFFIDKSERDKLTGLLNRHSFDTKFRRLIKAQERKQRQAFEDKATNKQRKRSTDSYAWLAIFDIDHFKRVNDQYGHVCGDEVLLRLSQKMKAFFRSSDLLFRFGGEEFVIILEPIPYEMAQRTLERFREKVESSIFPLVNKITTSGGYIRITDSDYPTVFIERADQALYYAKNHGRNTICNYDLLVDCGELPKPKEIGVVDLF